MKGPVQNILLTSAHPIKQHLSTNRQKGGTGSVAVTAGTPTPHISGRARAVAQSCPTSSPRAAAPRFLCPWVSQARTLEWVVMPSSTGLFPTQGSTEKAMAPHSSPLCPWDFLGKSPGVGCHCLLQGIFLTQGSNPCLLCLLHCRRILYPLSHWLY